MSQEGLKHVQKLLRPPLEEPAPKTPKWPAILIETAERLSKTGDHQGAIEIYQQLAQDFPQEPEYFYQIGREFGKLEYNREAIEAYKQVLALKPEHVDALVEPGRLYLILDQKCAHQRSLCFGCIARSG